MDGVDLEFFGDNIPDQASLRDFNHFFELFAREGNVVPFEGGHEVGEEIIGQASDVLQGNFDTEVVRVPPSPEQLPPDGRLADIMNVWDDLPLPPPSAVSRDEMHMALPSQDVVADRHRLYPAIPRAPTVPVQAVQNPAMQPPKASQPSAKKRQLSVDASTSDDDVVFVGAAGPVLGSNRKENEGSQASSVKRKKARVSEEARVKVKSEKEVVVLEEGVDRAKHRWERKEVQALVDATLGVDVSDELFQRLVAKNKKAWEKVSDIVLGLSDADAKPVVV
ncbi:uncharacterized protein B0H18DRAFT_527019 [Fomitopsis serialis]|uniref:uncharacterized protein n=1 Tax=Fomitopsis serialis TaxID=139415 RepID=UPI0020089D1C|nr:uncharacterized protein B0H18DRAFT_527019 [Neoantrodia serialis]KAH9922085.1 hypothetical protein B0H18DRAFT_527019 [Neoantrodia serialis]